MLKVLVGCEESQAVCIEFRKLGHEAYSCDILPCSGGHPEWHLKMDVRKAIRGGYLPTQDGGRVFIKEWNIIGLHNPCTYTALCGNKHYYNSPLRIEGAEFTKETYELACALCDKVYLEQPKTIMQRYIGLKSQVIHPWMFGHKEYKETWLWLKGLPPLTETSNVLKWMLADDRKKYEKVFRMDRSADRGQKRSKTYLGIAFAIANQYGNPC